MTLRGSVGERRARVRILLLQILPDLPCTIDRLSALLRAQCLKSTLVEGDQVTASNGNMHDPLLLNM